MEWVGCATSVPAGMVTPLENVKGRRARRYDPTSQDRRNSKGERPSVTTLGYAMGGERNLTDSKVGCQFSGFPERSCRSCASCPFRPWSNLPSLPRHRPLGEVVQYIPDGLKGGIAFV